MSRQCSECKTVSILPLDIVLRQFSRLEFIPPQYQCFKCGKVFTEKEYKELDEGGYIYKIPVVECDIEC